MSDVASAPQFSADVIAAVTAHMNTDHPEDNLLIVRSLGGLPDATSATMAGYDEVGAQFDAEVGGSVTRAVVPWAVPITERATIRQEVVRMYHDACAALGVEPRRAGEH